MLYLQDQLLSLEFNNLLTGTKIGDLKVVAFIRAFKKIETKSSFKNALTGCFG